MTPQIYPGLSTPKSKLYFDLQAMIAKNGGRLHLADRLECEMVKTPKRKTTPKIGWGKKWSITEIDTLIFNKDLRAFDICILLDKKRSLSAIELKRWWLNQKGLL